VSVDIVLPRETDDRKQGGPTPVGEYLIGRRIQHPTHKIDWYQLYPRMEDKWGYYGYTERSKTGRFAMGLHPGSVSLGCVTVKSTDTPYDKSEIWRSVQKKLDASMLTTKGAFTGFLYVVDK
jgi:hypothetical protein